MSDGFFIPEDWAEALDPDGSIREALAREDQDPPERCVFMVQGYVDEYGRAYIYFCPKCFQPLAQGQRCNSGIHQGPEDGNEGIAGVKSVDLATTFFTELSAMITTKQLIKLKANDLWHAGTRMHATLSSGKASARAVRERKDDWNEAWREVKDVLGL